MIEPTITDSRIRGDVLRGSTIVRPLRARSRHAAVQSGNEICCCLNVGFPPGSLSGSRAQRMTAYRPNYEFMYRARRNNAVCGFTAPGEQLLARYPCHCRMVENRRCVACGAKMTLKIIGATASVVLPQVRTPNLPYANKTSNVLFLIGKLAPAVGIEPTTN